MGDVPDDEQDYLGEAQQLTLASEQLAARVLAADPADLQALAAVHTSFAQLSEQIAAAHDQALPVDKLRDCSARGQKLIERIILAEVSDTAEALAGVGQAIAELQSLLTGSSGGSAVAPQPANSASQQAVAAPADHSAEYSENAINSADLPLITEFISEAGGHIEAAEAEMLKLEEGPENTESVNAVFRCFHTIKGVAGFLNLRQIGALAHAAENLLDQARQGKLRLVGGAVDLVLQSLDAMKSMLAQIDHAAKHNAAIPVREDLPGLIERLREAASGKIQTQTPAAPAATSRPPADASPIPSPSSHSAPADATVKVSTDRLDRLIDTVGELVIAQSMVSQDLSGATAANQRLARNMAHLGKITRGLQDLSMSLRMVPINGVFQKMNRLVRDLGRKCCREIDFSVSGAETELDRNVVEAISDPLVHMVRNAVDHGLEDPDTRVGAGKPRAGRITLGAYHQAGSIVIEIADDGRGLNKAKIVKKAIQAGIVREGQELSESEIFKLIFHAGLSTAEKVTDVSGRGVGMDVVRRNVEALRGRIDIASVEGKGSTFTIRLPLTLAVIDGLIVRVGAERYIVPLTSIEQSFRPQASQLSSVQGRGEMCMVRGQLLPLFRLHRLFGVTPRTTDATQGLVVIVQDNQRRCGLLVDELLGQQQVVIKSLGEALGHVPGVSGGAVLGDGNVGLILDVPGLVELATNSSDAQRSNGDSQ